MAVRQATLNWMIDHITIVVTLTLTEVPYAGRRESLPGSMPSILAAFFTKPGHQTLWQYADRSDTPD